MEFSCNTPEGSPNPKWRLNGIAWEDNTTIPGFEAIVTANGRKIKFLKIPKLSNETKLNCWVYVNADRFDLRDILTSNTGRIYFKGIMDSQ